MKTLLSKWFIAGCIIWVVVLVFRRTGHPIPFFNGYINDAFAIPVVANLGLCFQRVYIVKSNYYVLSPWHVIFITIYVSVIFEVVLPFYSKAYTADWIDVLLYAIGGLFFYFVMNRPILEHRLQKSAPLHK